MYKSPNRLPEESRSRVIETLSSRLADGVDLYTQVKVAHWNIKGPQFVALHPLFDQFAQDLLVENDTIAERIATLGGKAYGTARYVSKTSRIPEYPREATRDLDHVGLLAERFETYLDGLRDSRTVAEKVSDADTVDVLTSFIEQFEKHAWFLRATLDS